MWARRTLLGVFATALAANPTAAAIDGLFPDVANVARRLPVTVRVYTVSLLVF